MDDSVINKDRFTGIATDCYTCVLNQARSASGFAELSGDQTDQVISVAEKWLEKSKAEPLLVQHIVRYVEDEVARQRGELPGFDIYAAVKKQSNDLALGYAEECRKIIDKQEGVLDVGLQMAAAGNIIDFGAKGRNSIDIEKELGNLTEVSFSRYDIKQFQDALKGSLSLLYLCDNCGEIVFDMLFMEQLQRIYPDLEITAALRDIPTINDATLDDAKAVGLDLLVNSISSGSVYPGTILAETTQEFRDKFAAADVILAKGQGNFETLLPIKDSRLFFLLRIKCEYMASLSGVQKDSLVLMQGGSRAED